MLGAERSRQLRFIVSDVGGLFTDGQGSLWRRSAPAGSLPRHAADEQGDRPDPAQRGTEA